MQPEGLNRGTASGGREGIKHSEGSASPRWWAGTSEQAKEAGEDHGLKLISWQMSSLAHG
eukprot:12915388-Prorocentrum_lima.AAC.1